MKIIKKATKTQMSKKSDCSRVSRGWSENGSSGIRVVSMFIKRVYWKVKKDKKNSNLYFYLFSIGSSKMTSLYKK